MFPAEHILRPRGSATAETARRHAGLISYPSALSSSGTAGGQLPPANPTSHAMLTVHMEKNNCQLVFELTKHNDSENMALITKAAERMAAHP